MELIDIRDYVQKTAEIISGVVGLEVLLCDRELRIVGDSKRVATGQKELPRLTPDSHMAETIRRNRRIITRDSKTKWPGCRRCPRRASCDVNAILSIPILDKKRVFCGIGLYAERNEEIQRLIENNDGFEKFIRQMGELMIMKAREEEQTRELKRSLQSMQTSGGITFDSIIGGSREIQALKKDARRFAKGDSTILLQGESGTGKEIFARAIHNESRRAKGPFIAINCAALPEALIESELFGYEEGAFTGAVKGGHIGKIQMADKGTLFLDEVGEFPLHLQAKLLRVLQEWKITRIGGSKEIPVDVRVIAATNRDLETQIGNGEFREDLYYRLSVIPLTIPSLRERAEDILPLAEHFLEKYTAAMEKSIDGFDAAVQRALQKYDWPGNIRQLQNTVEYAASAAVGSKVGMADLPKKLFYESVKADGTYPAQPSVRPAGRISVRPLREVEEECITEALRIYGETKEGKTLAAEALGIGRATLYRRLKEMRRE